MHVSVYVPAYVRACEQADVWAGVQAGVHVCVPVCARVRALCVVYVVCTLCIRVCIILGVWWGRWLCRGIAAKLHHLYFPLVLVHVFLVLPSVFLVGRKQSLHSPLKKGLARHQAQIAFAPKTSLLMLDESTDTSNSRIMAVDREL